MACDVSRGPHSKGLSNNDLPFLGNHVWFLSSMLLKSPKKFHWPHMFYPTCSIESSLFCRWLRNQWCPWQGHPVLEEPWKMAVFWCSGSTIFGVWESNRTIRHPKDDDIRPELMLLNHTHPNRGQCFWSKFFLYLGRTLSTILDVWILQNDVYTFQWQQKVIFSFQLRHWFCFAWRYRSDTLRFSTGTDHFPGLGKFFHFYGLIPTSHDLST